jgi:DNA-binding FrmR family transcriptional regulator
MRFDNAAVPEALRNLRRVEGQIGGIIRMIENGRDCAEVIQQIAAARVAMNRAGLRLLASQLVHCMNDEARARGEGYDPERFEHLFLTLR